ncbi:RDD family protein [Bacillus sp. MM2020_1]|nr:RDD family protein [Bacillus sp. MM2020_1]
MEMNEYQEINNDRNENYTVRYAGFWMRFWAYLLDLVVVGSIVRLLIKPVFRILDIPLAEANMFAPASIAAAVIFYLYFVLMTKYFNQTLGKMVFGLKVVDLKSDQLTWGTILFREWIGRFISATIIIGYIIVAFLPKKQGLHDLFTDTTVIHVER